MAMETVPNIPDDTAVRDTIKAGETGSSQVGSRNSSPTMMTSRSEGHMNVNVAMEDNTTQKSQSKQEIEDFTPFDGPKSQSDDGTQPTIITHGKLFCLFLVDENMKDVDAAAAGVEYLEVGDVAMKMNGKERKVNQGKVYVCCYWYTLELCCMIEENFNFSPFFFSDKSIEVISSFDIFAILVLFLLFFFTLLYCSFLTDFVWRWHSFIQVSYTPLFSVMPICPGLDFFCFSPYLFVMHHYFLSTPS